MNIASIDIGTNTVLMLIAEIDISCRKINPIGNYYEMPRIGKNVKNTGVISEEKITELKSILKEYKSIADSYNCRTIIVSATNAFRIAENSNSIINNIIKELGIKIEVINGDTEAKFSFLGSTFEHRSENDKLVIDIGGGSTELIFGSKKNLVYNKSFQIGVVSLTENYFPNQPISLNNIDEAEHFLNNTFSEIKNEIPTGVFTIGVAGTPTTLSCISQNLKEYSDKNVENSEIDLDNILEIMNELKLMSIIDIRNKFGSVVKGREDVIFAGSLILTVIMKLLEIHKISVSTKGLRYGAVVNYMLSYTGLTGAKNISTQ